MARYFMFTFIIVFFNINAKSLGDWESSGGSGVFCKNKVYPLEYWEYFYEPFHPNSKNNFLTVKPTVGKTLFHLNSKLTELKKTKTILNEVDRLIRRLSPLLADRLQFIYNKYPLDKWSATTEPLAIINDSQPIHPLNDCKKIQIVKRIEKRTNFNVSQNLGNLEFVYNAKAFQSLTPIMIATLQLHEAIYIMARKTNHINSDFIREVVAYLFSEDFKNLSEGHNIYSETMIKQRVHFFRQKVIGIVLGDYMRFFIDDPEIDSFSQKNKFTKALIAVMKKLRHEKSLCIQTPDAKYCETPFALLDNPNTHKTFTDLEAFIFNSRFGFDVNFDLPFGHSGLLYASDKFLHEEFYDDNTKSYLSHDALEEIVCYDLFFATPFYKLAREKARNYCRKRFNHFLPKLKKIIPEESHFK